MQTTFLNVSQLLSGKIYLLTGTVGFLNEFVNYLKKDAWKMTFLKGIIHSVHLPQIWLSDLSWRLQEPPKIKRKSYRCPKFGGDAKQTLEIRVEQRWNYRDQNEISSQNWELLWHDFHDKKLNRALILLIWEISSQNRELLWHDFHDKKLNRALILLILELRKSRPKIGNFYDMILVTKTSIEPSYY